MNKLNFKKWFSTLRTKQDDVYSFKYFVNFPEVYKQMDQDELKICLNMLDSLCDVAPNSIEQMFRKILRTYRGVKKYLPLLIAVKLSTNDATLNLMDPKTSEIYQYDFNDLAHLDEDKLCFFMQEAGIFDLYLHHLTSSTWDYVTGALVGLSSNGRKNRSGQEMEQYVYHYLANKLTINQDFYYQLTKEEFAKLFHFSIPYFNERRPDFVLYNKNTNEVFIVEVNYYHSQGSKLSKVCGDYIKLNESIDQLNSNCHFVWITDGPGWQSETLALEQAYNKITYLLNLNDFNDGKLLEIYHHLNSRINYPIINK